jgi:threonine synthase
MPGPAGPLPVAPPTAASSPPIEVRPGLWFKGEMQQETGTFKDRGAAAMLGVGRALGVDRVAADSSGNAARAVAHFGARLGMEVSVFVPASTAPEVVAVLERLGASVVSVGDREGAARAARAHVRATGAWYGSHVYQPAFHHGVKMLAYELASLEPAAVVVPAGNGTLVLGLWLGFRELDQMPRIIAVQAEQCAPLAGRAPRGPTAATGIAIAVPPRLPQVRAAVLASRGSFLLAKEADLVPAQRDLAEMGFDVSLTSAAVWAGLGRGTKVPAGTGGPVVVVLSGGPGVGQPAGSVPHVFL